MLIRALAGSLEIEYKQMSPRMRNTTCPSRRHNVDSEYVLLCTLGRVLLCTQHCVLLCAVGCAIGDYVTLMYRCWQSISHHVPLRRLLAVQLKSGLLCLRTEGRKDWCYKNTMCWNSLFLNHGIIFWRFLSNHAQISVVWINTLHLRNPAV